MGPFLKIINGLPCDIVTVTGGEPGLLKTWQWEMLLNFLPSKKLRVNTNGLMFKRHYDITKSLDAVYYHPISELDEPEPNLVLPANTSVQVVVTRKNLNLVQWYLNKTRHNSVTLIPYVDKSGKAELILDCGDIDRLYQIALNNDNVSGYTVGQLRDIHNSSELHIKSLRMLCSASKPMFPSIDLTRGKIRKCICSHSLAPSIPLTLENLKNLDELEFPPSPVCDTCWHVTTRAKQLIRGALP